MERLKGGPTIKDSGDQELIERVRTHLGEEFLDWTKDQIVHYQDGGRYGGTPDPRSLAADRETGMFTARGGSGPKKPG